MEDTALVQDLRKRLDEQQREIDAIKGKDPAPVIEGDQRIVDRDKEDEFLIQQFPMTQFVWLNQRHGFLQAIAAKTSPYDKKEIVKQGVELVFTSYHGPGSDLPQHTRPDMLVCNIHDQLNVAVSPEEQERLGIPDREGEGLYEVHDPEVNWTVSEVLQSLYNLIQND